MAGECRRAKARLRRARACVGRHASAFAKASADKLLCRPYRRASMVSRVERTRYANWWWTVDRLMLAALAVLMLTGIVLSLAASPAVASRIGLDAFYFVNRQAMFLVPSLVVMIATSFLAPRQIRRVALVVFVIALAMTAATLFFGAEVKGARRWIVL